MRTPETILAAHVVKKLESLHYKVYQEVPIVIDGQTYPIDIVAILEDRVVCVEVKRNLQPYVIEQAGRNQRYCNQSWVAVPEPKTLSESHKKWRQYCATGGTGLMYISPSGKISKQVIALEQDRLDNRIIDDSLCERQTTGLAAGSAAGKRSLKDEWEPVRKLLKESPNLTIKQIANELGLSARDRKRLADQAHKLNIAGIKRDNGAPAKYYLESA